MLYLHMLLLNDRLAVCMPFGTVSQLTGEVHFDETFVRRKDEHPYSP